MATLARLAKQAVPPGVPGPSMIESITKGFALGLSTGIYCAAACAPVMLPYLVAHDSRSRGRHIVSAIAQFAGGRLVAYIVVGAVAAALGAELMASGPARRVAGLAVTALAGLMLAYGLGRSFPEARLCRRLAQATPVSRFPLAAGLLTGINVCPPFLLLLAALVTSANVAHGVLMALAFFLGTSLFLVPLGFVGYLGVVPRLRGVAEVAALFAGLWFLATGAAMLVA